MESRAAYLHRRAKEEDAAAARSANDKVRNLHLELATRYREAVEEDPAHVDLETVGTTAPKEFRILD